MHDWTNRRGRSTGIINPYHLYFHRSSGERYIPYYQIQVERVQPSSFARRHSTALGRDQIQHYRPLTKGIKNAMMGHRNRYSPELPDIMEPELIRPDANHAPEWDKDCHDVRNDKLKDFNQNIRMLKEQCEV